MLTVSLDLKTVNSIYRLQLMDDEMEKKAISDYTEAEFLEFVKKICLVSDYKTEDEHTNAVLKFETLSEHPDGSDLFYYPKEGQDDSPEGIVKEVKEWRAANGKSGFKDS